MLFVFIESLFKNYIDSIPILAILILRMPEFFCPKFGKPLDREKGAIYNQLRFSVLTNPASGKIDL